MQLNDLKLFCWRKYFRLSKRNKATCWQSIEILSLCVLDLGGLLHVIQLVGVLLCNLPKQVSGWVGGSQLPMANCRVYNGHMLYTRMPIHVKESEGNTPGFEPLVCIVSKELIHVPYEGAAFTKA